MENALVRVFESTEFGSVRTASIDGEPWFVAADVCKALDIKNNRMAIARLDDDEKDVSLIDTVGGHQKMVIVNEPGLYTLVLGSRKPEAKRFKKWIAHEVIPTIRKTGSYSMLQTPAERMAYGLLAAQEIIKEKDARIAMLEPKGEFYDMVTASEDELSMEQAAKLLNIPGFGRNRLFDMLRCKGVLMSNNRPYQSFINRGYFHVTEVPYESNGIQRVNLKTCVTNKGIEFIRRMM